MNTQEERFQKKSYNGFFRALIIEVDEDTKNGRYKVRVFPFDVNTADQVLPYALSNQSVDNHFEPYYITEWVWVFFECGDPHFPIIFDRCNAKLHYPVQAQADEEPAYYSNIETDANIDEGEVEYKSEYNKATARNFGDPAEEPTISLEIDELNKQILLMSDIWQVILSNIDDVGNLHLKMDSMWTKLATMWNMHVGDNIIKINEDGIYFEDANGNKITKNPSGIVIEDMFGNIIEMTSQGVKITDLTSNSFKMTASGIIVQGLLGKLEVL